MMNPVASPILLQDIAICRNGIAPAYAIDLLKQMSEGSEADPARRIADSDQGKSSSVFWEFLLSSHRQEELTRPGWRIAALRSL